MRFFSDALPECNKNKACGSKHKHVGRNLYRVASGHCTEQFKHSAQCLSVIAPYSGCIVARSDSPAANTMDMKCARSRLDKSVISRTWCFQITRQNPG